MFRVSASGATSGATQHPPSGATTPVFCAGCDGSDTEQLTEQHRFHHALIDLVSYMLESLGFPRGRIVLFSPNWE